MTTIIFVLELVALAVLIICGALPVKIDTIINPSKKISKVMFLLLIRYPLRYLCCFLAPFRPDNGQKNVQRRILPRRI